MTEPIAIARQFPPEVRDALVRASRIEDERLRMREIERVTEQARRKYPEFFRREGP